ncbi:MAG: hypothetical protein AAF958_18875 [Planctomycetota bacterium]
MPILLDTRTPLEWSDRTLCLVPTERERRVLCRCDSRFESAQVIGFGLVEAMIGTLRVLDTLATKPPDQVLLLGIAGSMDSKRWVPGHAYRFGQVDVDGIGVGQAGDFRSDVDLGWREAEATLPTTSHPASPSHPAILSVASASANPVEATWRQNRFPGFAAEDMETYSVARLCQSRGIVLSCIRGISNSVGDRDHERWKVEQALAAVATMIG